MRRKGEITHRQIDRDWPYQVRIRIPPNTGLGTRLNDMLGAAAEIERGYTSRSDLQGLEDFVRFCFRGEAAAAEFHRRFGGELVTTTVRSPS